MIYYAVAIDESKYCRLYFVQNCEWVFTLAWVGAVRVKAVLIFLTRRRIFGALVYIWENREIDWFPKYELVLILKLGKLGNLPGKIHTNNMRMSSLKTYRTYYSWFLIIVCIWLHIFVHVNCLLCRFELEDTTLTPEACTTKLDFRLNSGKSRAFRSYDAGSLFSRLDFHGNLCSAANLLGRRLGCRLRDQLSESTACWPIRAPCAEFKASNSYDRRRKERV